MSDKSPDGEWLSLSNTDAFERVSDGWAAFCCGYSGNVFLVERQTQTKICQDFL